MPGFSYPGGFYPGGEAPPLGGAPPTPQPILLAPAVSTSSASLEVFIPGPGHPLHGPTHAPATLDPLLVSVTPDTLTVTATADSLKVKAEADTTKVRLLNYG